MSKEEKLIHYLYECVQEWVIPNIHSEDLMNLEFLQPFVRRLIEKDKIQYTRIPEHRYVSDHCEKCIYEWMTDNVLMWLAISDTPVEDLISYLKD